MPTTHSKEAAEQAGVKFFASVGMVTEFSRYYERFPQTYEEGLCRDIDGQPVKSAVVDRPPAQGCSLLVVLYASAAVPRLSS